MAPAAPSITSSTFGRGTRFGRGSGTFAGHGNNGVPLRSFVPRHDRDHHRRNDFVAPVAPIYYYPYYGYGASGYYDDYSDLPGAGTFDNGQGYDDYEGEAPTVFENRRPSQMYYTPNAGANSVLDNPDRYGDHYTDSREDTRTAAPAPGGSQVVTANGNENNDITTVLVFKDGMKREVTNYAIMGQYIFVFSGDRRKIPLSEIDVDATTKANEDRGIQFKVPGSTKPS
jgi:hypothetical protein